MDSSMYTQWVQSPIQESATHEPRASTSLDVDDWVKDRSAQSNSTSEIADFSALADLGAPSFSSGSHPQQHFPYGAFYLPAPYNTMPYGNAWTSAVSSVPLSSYSSLNGATSSNSPQPPAQMAQHASPQQQPAQPPQQSQQQSPASQPMMIDPVLTMNSTSQSVFSQYPQQQPQQSQPGQPRPQYYNPMLYSSYYRPQSTNAPQGTLSPQALHSPSSMMPITTSSFYAPLQQHMQPTQSPVASTSQVVPLVAAPSPPVPTPQEREERNRQFQAAIRPMLTQTSFTGAMAVTQLTDKIIDYGVSEVDALMRLEILAQIRDGAGNHYYRAWSENASAIDITREWIKAAAKGSNTDLLETIMPLLHLIDRLPFTFDTLVASKLGKIIKKLVKDEPSPAIKDMASNLERRWQNLISEKGSTKVPESKASEDVKARKRKLSEAAPVKSQSQKKVAVGSGTSTKPMAVKKEVKPPLPVQAVKDAKADSSFFSAPKPKPKAKLPSFKKAPPMANPLQLKKEDTGNVSLPSSFDPFQEVLMSMKTRKDSPAVSTPPAVSASSSESHSGLGKNGRKRKAVSWAPDHQLESIKLIERAVYDDDPVDGTHFGHSIRDLERGEGAALHSHMFEETVDWMEPMLVDVAPDLDINGQTPRVMARGTLSEEKTRQEEREQTALGAVYVPNRIPETPSEPSSVMAEEEVDKDVKLMTSGPQLEALLFAWNGVGGAEPMTTMSVADLVGQLAGGNVHMMEGMGMAAMNGAVSAGANPELQAAVTSLPQEQLQRLLQQLVPTTQFVGYNSGVDGNNNWMDYSHYQDETGSGENGRWSEGRGVRGRGRGRGVGRGRGEEGYRPYIKRKPCSFFAAGRRALNLKIDFPHLHQNRCKYGDQCDFSHEQE